MRPFSTYLDLVKRERIKVRYNLTGTTPLVPAQILSKIRIDSTEAPHARVNSDLIKMLQSHLGAEENQLALAPGCSHALSHVLAAVSDVGDTILIETPTYEPFLATARFLGLKVRRFQRTGKFELDYRAIKAGSKGAKAILISNPGCPTGHLYDSEELTRLSALGPSLIVDEIYLPLFDKGSMTRLKDPLSIHVSGISKSSGLSSARVGWVRADKRVIENVRRVSTVFNVDMPTASLQVAEVALRKWKEILRPTLETIRQNERIAGGLPAVEPPAGSFVSLHVPKRFGSGHGFAKALFRKSVWVRPGELFEIPGTVRISLLGRPSEFQRACNIISGFYA